MRTILKSTTALAAAAIACGTAYGADFNIPAGDLSSVLAAYTKQTGVTMFYAADEMQGKRSHGIVGNLPADEALSRILSGTGFGIHREGGGVEIIRDSSQSSSELQIAPIQIAQASPSRAAVETVTVTSSKLGGADVQSIPIAITALSQEQLTSRQVAGGPDLVKEVPNLTFSKTNFTGYNIQIRGIGTQAISVTTDPAVAVAFNDIPFIRNHFFEQEFYDLSQAEVLRGPQGTLYGRNATAGVVNIISAKPTDQFEAMASGDIGNYSNRRFEGMINLPVVDDRLDIRVAGEWTKRNGYTYDESLGTDVDGRDLWSTRITLGWKPIQNLQIYAVWEHFQESDDRVRSAKQLCKKDVGLTNIDGLDVTTLQRYDGTDLNAKFTQAWLSQGCLPTSLYSNEAYETPNGQVIPFVALGEFGANAFGGADGGFLLKDVDPYANQNQPRSLRTIQSLIKPSYRARNDTLELNADYKVTPTLTLTSQTGYNKDFLFSTEDFNRFDTTSGIFYPTTASFAIGATPIAPNGIYCDPQLGCSSSMVAQDLSDEHAWQFSQELRLASNFDGPLNFSLGANYMHYETVEDYYVFFNLLTAFTQLTNGQSPGDFTLCHSNASNVSTVPIAPEPFKIGGPNGPQGVSTAFGCGGDEIDGRAIGTYIDPNPIGQLNGQGHSYFRSENPYKLNSYAGFGEAYYQVTPELKLTAGLRWTDDQKTFWDIPSWTFLLGGGYPVEGVVNQGWKEWTGRAVANWTPKLDFTDQTLIYASYARGYKGGGANPPQPETDFTNAQTSIAHPATFAPEFVNSYELGAKNSMLDGAITFNGDVFYYDYKGYQISQIVDRTSINLNFDAKVKGGEVEASYEPLPGLKFNFAGGYEKTSVDKGQSAIDLMDRTAGQPGWIVLKPYFGDTSNCILPATVVRQLIEAQPYPDLFGSGLSGACDAAYNPGGLSSFGAALDQAVFANAGFDPATAPNNGEGFAKDLSGNELPNAPHFTTSFGVDYTIPLTGDWAATLHGDFYWQSESWARILNDDPYDRLHGYTNVNLALILTAENGWQVMGYLKNVFNTAAITGAFLNSDDTALTTNVFVTDPRLFGVRVTKNW